MLLIGVIVRIARAHAVGVAQSGERVFFEQVVEVVGVVVGEGWVCFKAGGVE